MTLVKTVLIIISTFILASCGNHTQTTTEKTAEKNQAQIAPLLLDTFSKYPLEINGCACNFAATDKDFESGKFIYVNNLTDIAYISINKEFIKLALLKNDSLHNSSTYCDKDKNFEVIIETKSNKQNGGEESESSFEKGIITLKAKDGRIFSCKYYGICGC